MLSLFNLQTRKLRQDFQIFFFFLNNVLCSAERSNVITFDLRSMSLTECELGCASPRQSDTQGRKKINLDSNCCIVQTYLAFKSL